MALVDTRIRSAKKAKAAYKLTDSNGLYLEVRPTGKKLWRYRYRIAGKENVFALGVYVQPPSGETEEAKKARIDGGYLTLTEAREAREKARQLVKQGIHPSHNRQALKAAQITANANTLEAVAREWMANRKAKKKWTPYYAGQVERFLSADVFPYVGSLPIRNVGSDHMLEILKRVEKRAPTVALLIRQWCSKVFRYAVATRRADIDPTIALQEAVERPKVEHRKPLTRAAIPGFLKALNESGGYPTTLIALRLLLFTFVRPIELRAAEWLEFDFDEAEWRIPAERMKMREQHIVPLSTQAVGLLKELQGLTGSHRWLFPNYRRPKTFMTATTLNRALERMGYSGKFSAHGFRATASTILNEMGYRPDVIERQLAHKERNKTRAAYHQSEYLEERRQMMQAWADFIEATAAGKKVLPIRKAG